MTTTKERDYEYGKAVGTALRRVQHAQTKFWDALRELENALGVDELDGEDNTDWNTYDVDDVIDQFVEGKK